MDNLAGLVPAYLMIAARETPFRHGQPQFCHLVIGRASAVGRGTVRR